MSATLRGGLIDVPRDAWAGDPRFHGEPEFWLQIHHSLLSSSAELPTLCESVMEAAGTRDLQVDARLTSARLKSQYLVQHAHHHHHVEDHHFFPVFARACPTLAPHLALLDGDHRVLAAVLERMISATAALPDNALQGQGGSASALDDSVLGPVERLLAAAVDFDTLFRRHIGDEEEICIPIMLRG